MAISNSDIIFVHFLWVYPVGGIDTASAQTGEDNTISRQYQLCPTWVPGNIACTLTPILACGSVAKQHFLYPRALPSSPEGLSRRNTVSPCRSYSPPESPMSTCPQCNRAFSTTHGRDVHVARMHKTRSAKGRTASGDSSLANVATADIVRELARRAGQMERIKAALQ